MSRGLVHGAVWLTCLLLPACGYNPKTSHDALTNADTSTATGDSAGPGNVVPDTGTKDTGFVPDNRTTVETLGPAAEVSPTDVSAPAPDTSPTPADSSPALADTNPATEPDASTSVQLDARVFEDVARIVDRPQDLPPNNPPLPLDTAVPSPDTYRTCGAPPDAPNGQVGYALPINVGSVATYTCNLGFRPTSDGSAEVKRTCLADGTWDGQAFECGPVNCGPPPAVSNGNTPLYTTTTYKSTATYSCLDNYVLSDPGPVSCQDTGTWGPLPTCARQQYTLTVTKTGMGAGTVTDASTGINCGATCAVKLDVGTPVSLTASAGTDQSFIEWGTASCPGRGPCSFNLTGNTTVSPYFSPPPNIMFVTSTAQSANLGGLAGADTLCTQKAHTAGLAGNYKAWLSTPTVSASSRMGAASGWVRPDGKPVFNTIEDIAFNKFFYPPRLDENLGDVGRAVVMTATNYSGTFYNSDGATSCNDFALPPVANVIGGYPSANSNLFSWGQLVACQDAQRIYCMGVDRTARVVPPTPVAGRYAFTTKQRLKPGSGGIAAADSLCQTEATQAKLPGTYKALMAATGKTAASRFTATGLPWVRVDGIPLTATASGFFSATLLDVSPNLSADGTQYFGLDGAWTGAESMTTPGTDATNCADWKSSATTSNAYVGKIGVTDTAAFFYGWGIDCNGAYNLICLQE